MTGTFLYQMMKTQSPVANTHTVRPNAPPYKASMWLCTGKCCSHQHRLILDLVDLQSSTPPQRPDVLHVGIPVASPWMHRGHIRGPLARPDDALWHCRAGSKRSRRARNSIGRALYARRPHQQIVELHGHLACCTNTPRIQQSWHRNGAAWKTLFE